MNHRSIAAVSIVSISAFCFLLSAFSFAAAVEPATLPLALYRDAAPSSDFTTNVVYYQGDYISFSNSVAYSTPAGTNAVVQNLTDATVTVRVGNDTTNNLATGYVIVGTNGTWGAEVIVPPVTPCYVEVTCSNVWNYTYRRERIQTQAHLGE